MIDICGFLTASFHLKVWEIIMGIKKHFTDKNIDLVTETIICGYFNIKNCRPRLSFIKKLHTISNFMQKSNGVVQVAKSDTSRGFR